MTAQECMRILIKRYGSLDKVAEKMEISLEMAEYLLNGTLKHPSSEFINRFGSWNISYDVESMRREDIITTIQFTKNTTQFAIHLKNYGSFYTMTKQEMLDRLSGLPEGPVHVEMSNGNRYDILFITQYMDDNDEPENGITLIAGTNPLS